MGEDRRGAFEEQPFEVVPTPIGGASSRARSDRRRRAPIIIVLVVAALIPVLAWVGPRIEWRPEIDLSFLRPTPTPVPSKTPRPVFGTAPLLATPGPMLTVSDGPHPTQPFPVDVGGLRLADPKTGALGPTLGLRGDNDVIFRSPAGDTWWCVCFTRIGESNQETATAEIKRVDSAGHVTGQSNIGTYRSVATPPFQDFSVRFDLEVSPDQTIAFLASATRTGNKWAITVEAIDIRTLTVVGHTDLGTAVIPPIVGPTPSPDQGVAEDYFAGPFLRLSPDGRRLLVWAWVESNSATEASQPTKPQGWLINVDEAAAGSPGPQTPVAPDLAVRLRACYWATWTTLDELAAICWPTPPSTSNIMTLSLFSLDGTERRRFDLFDPSSSWLAEPLLDRANRRVFMWQPTDHTLRRLNLDSGNIDLLKVDPAATVVGPSTSQGSGQGSGRSTDWASFTSDFRINYAPQLVGDSGSGRLFALGVPSNDANQYNPSSSGVWVFDTGTFTLRDRWPAVAAYTSIGMSPDGRWLLAAGAPGFDERGKQTAGEASITVYDVSDGRPAMQFGRLGIDVQVLQAPP
jgi:hypothetical protein